jgi:hypothetical protein
MPRPQSCDGSDPEEMNMARPSFPTGKATLAFVAGVALVALLVFGAPAPAFAASPECGSVCTASTDWCATVTAPVVTSLRAAVLASRDLAASALAAIPSEPADPYRHTAQYNVNLHDDALAAIDGALAAWDLSTVSSTEGGGVQGMAQTVVHGLDLASYYGTVSAIHFGSALEWESAERSRALIGRAADIGTRAARCYMAPYLAPPATCP